MTHERMQCFHEGSLQQRQMVLILVCSKFIETCVCANNYFNIKKTSTNLVRKYDDAIF